jgi:hypothetical protein
MMMMMRVHVHVWVIVFLFLNTLPAQASHCLGVSLATFRLMHVAHHVKAIMLTM